MDILADYYEDCINKFDVIKQDAQDLLSIGEQPIKPGDNKETAALMMVAQVLYNLDETITKE
jgi:hypothetical protein